MPYPAKHIPLQKQYNDPLPVVMRGLLNESGWEGVSDEFHIAESTVGEWIKLFEIQHVCIYLLPGETVTVNAAQPVAEADA